jgi:AraC-like DNA-binding protein
METRIVCVDDLCLAGYIQSFLFFRSHGEQVVNYTTFPNTNLCLAIYGQNDVSYIRNDAQNICNINYGSSLYQSRLYGFHEHPFNVALKSSLDQVCILFHPGALRAFTNIPFEELLKSNNAFDLIFKSSNDFFERLFIEEDLAERAAILERFLKDKLLYKALNTHAVEAMSIMLGSLNSALRVEDVANKMQINPSTLYRLFHTNIGQSPKMFLKTIRFRTALNYIRASKESLTDVAYLSQYYDQAHFIRDFKSLTGHAPNQLRKNLTTEQQQLTWLYKD